MRPREGNTFRIAVRAEDGAGASGAVGQPDEKDARGDATQYAKGFKGAARRPELAPKRQQRGGEGSAQHQIQAHRRVSVGRRLRAPGEAAAGQRFATDGVPDKQRPSSNFGGKRNWPVGLRSAAGERILVGLMRRFLPAAGVRGSRV